MTSGEGKVCRCPVCVYAGEVDCELAKLDEGARAFFEDMYSRLTHAETDRDWNLALWREATAELEAAGTQTDIKEP